MDINKLESAARKAWPALQEKESSYGVLRYAAGVSRRANSLTPAMGAALDLAQLLELCESFFFSRGLPSIVRVLADGSGGSLESGSLDQFLAAAGYQLEAPTAVLVKTLAGDGYGAAEHVAATSVADWLHAWYQVKGQSADEFHVHQQMLGQLTDEHQLLIARDESGTARATALGVLSDGLLGIYGVATESGLRRQGLAAGLLGQLFAWANGKGARWAYLQVEVANQPAVALYRKLGFENCYTYWYRSKHGDYRQTVATPVATPAENTNCRGQHHDYY